MKGELQVESAAKTHHQNSRMLALILDQHDGISPDPGLIGKGHRKNLVKLTTRSSAGFHPGDFPNSQSPRSLSPLVS